MFLLTKQIKKIKKVQVKQEKPENKQTTTGTIRFGQKKITISRSSETCGTDMDPAQVLTCSAWLCCSRNVFYVAGQKQTL